MTVRLFNFVGGNHGPWKVVHMQNVIGAGLERIDRLDIVEGQLPVTDSLPAYTWLLKGVTSYERYVHRQEQDSLKAIQPPLARSEATCAALIPIKKSTLWWDLPQDERRNIFETRSHHIEIGMKYLPAVARRLHHCHELGEPFDFLTWFEYAPAHSEAFETMLAELRTSEEWQYIDREIDIRLVREG